MATMETLEIADYLAESFVKAAEEAIAGGRSVLYSTATELLLDFDSEQGIQQYRAVRSKLDGQYGIVSETWWPSGSEKKGHAHMVVKLKESLTVQERIAMQAILGSDPVREMIALERLRMGISNPSRLFQSKGAKLQVGIPSFEDDDDLPF